MGGDLASIKSAGENDFIVNLIKNHPGGGRVSWNGAWIGLKRNQGGTSFSWVDGTSVSYSNWNRGEPNNSGGNENCGNIYARGSNSGYWNDLTCDRAPSFDNPVLLCQKPVS